MADIEVERFRARLTAIKTTLEKAPPKQKMDLVGRALADDFNSARAGVTAAYPELAHDVPQPIKFTSRDRRLKGDVNYLDLEAMCEQVLNLLSTVR